ncbi:hypothetical protein BJX63DRAFT_399282 [Aspergillus granulosus]|uniref:Heterokaryon incompatibility domain-containing protein n=1 Tax=Aspergillus granulosus TaxID=176169 RepID=A0ABR4H7L4_9EURO
MGSLKAITRDQVLAILDENVYKPTADDRGLRPIEMQFMRFGEIGEANNYELLNASETKARIVQWCRDAFALLDPKSDNLDSHFDRLDAFFSSLITCYFQLEKRKLERDTVVDKACALLGRLPEYPLEMSLEYDNQQEWTGLGDRWPVKYFSSSSAEDKYAWRNLQVLSRPSTNVLRIALFLSIEKSGAFTFTSKYADTLVSLLETVAELHKSSRTEADAQGWFILAAFLWAAWQQTVMLQLGYDAAIQLKLGYMYERHNHLISREIPSVMPSRQTIEKFRPQYMCKWAFELFRSDLSSVTQDFRQFFEIYNHHFGHRTPRCNLPAEGASQRICDGKAPGNCQRFESSEVKNQSAHDFECPGTGCSLLTWDEESYFNVQGARAVCLDQTDEKHLRYRPVSGKTMAISHVWSHGQGGRPETGINICLHRRYTALARSFGCNSYWMDTPCIPTDRELRAEAMGHINDNFLNSKLTLLIDRDIMEINIDPLTLQAEEAILATLVVCDWNVRAWTLLEGLRGRLKLQVMCRDNRVISLMQVLTDVVSKSCLSLVSACLATQHYTPTQYEVSELTDREPVTTEQATCLLNHRHATKDRDVTIIWSLVCGGSKVVKTAEEFWRSTVGQPVATGFLVSSSPRLKARGLSWAPARPNLLPPTATEPDTKRYPAFDGQNSVGGIITAEGLRAEWLACPIRRVKGLPMLFMLHTYADTKSDTDRFYKIYNSGGNSKMDLKSLLNLRSVIAPLLKQYRWVALLLPALRERLSTGAVFPPRPFPYQGVCSGPMLVIVASNDGEEWKWQFIHEWDVKFQLPEFSLVELLIV